MSKGNRFDFQSSEFDDDLKPIPPIQSGQDRGKLDFDDDGPVLEETVDALLKRVEKQVRQGNYYSCSTIPGPGDLGGQPRRVRRRAGYLRIVCERGWKGFITLHRRSLFLVGLLIASIFGSLGWQHISAFIEALKKLG